MNTLHTVITICFTLAISIVATYGQEIDLPENSYGFDTRLLLIDWIRNNTKIKLTGNETERDVKLIYRDAQWPNYKYLAETAKKIGIELQEFESIKSIENKIQAMINKASMIVRFGIDNSNDLPNDISKLDTIKIALIENEVIIIKLAKHQLEFYKQENESVKQKLWKEIFELESMRDAINMEISLLELKAQNLRQVPTTHPPTASTPAISQRDQVIEARAKFDVDRNWRPLPGGNSKEDAVKATSEIMKARSFEELEQALRKNIEEGR